MKKYIKGIYKKSIYESEKGYIIGIFKVTDTNDEEVETFINRTLTITGYFAELKQDDNYIFYGELIEHPKYGYQYNVTEYERLKPSDTEGLVEFLSSDLFKGIGEKLARNIVTILGNDCLDQILEDKSCLSLIPKLTKKKADTIYNTLNTYEKSHKTIVYLTELGFAMQDALEIYNLYKDNTVSQIESNIYKILDKTDNISFTKIDEIALESGIDKLDENRIKACIIYIMQQISYKNGDTYLTIEEIYDNLTKYLKEELDLNIFKSYIKELINEYKIITDYEKYYLKEIFDSELEIIIKIKILTEKKKSKYKTLEDDIIRLEEYSNIDYNLEQEEAIKSALRENITIITGGPGTGKTTIIKGITRLYQDLNKIEKEPENEIALLAPTGRAAKRLSESTLLPASTIHRFLKWNKEKNEFQVNEYDKAKQKLIIIDEVSMIDINLLASLFKGLTDNIKLVLVGDDNQLPSVGPGQILKDLINSELIKTIKLTILYRQKEDSYINKLAEEIRNNELSDNFTEQKSDYTFLECNTENIKQSLINISKQLQEKGYNYKKFQVMAPMYKGITGIDELNKTLQEVFNPYDDCKRQIEYGEVIFRENDKILQLVNMPEENVFNGDIGVIQEIIPANISESKKNEIYVDYDGNLVKYLPKDFNKIKHGYIISIHKSQGSEFDIVILPVSRTYKRMLYKKLIYTAITRAKRKLIILGEKEAFIYSINNTNEYIRKTSLEENLKKFLNNN